MTIPPSHAPILDPISFTAALSTGSPKIKLSPNPITGPINGILLNGFAAVFIVFFTNSFAEANPILDATFVKNFNAFLPNTLSITRLIPAVNPLEYAI